MKTDDIKNFKYSNVDPLGEEEKNSDDYLIPRIDRNISLAYSINNSEIKKAYDLRHGIRDVEQFDHITKKYGVEFPANLTHTPLIDRHVKALEGEMEELPLSYRISCLDKQSIQKITELRKQARNNAFNSQVNKSIQQSVDVQSGKKNTTVDYLSDEEVTKLEDFYSINWRSNIEIAAQHVLNYEIQNLNFKNFSDKTFSDLTTCGKEAYVSKIINNGKQHWFERIDPRAIFYTKPVNVEFIQDCDWIVYARRESITDVLSKWGDQLSKDDKLKLTNSLQYSQNLIAINNSPVISDYDMTEEGIEANDSRFVDVFYTEWKSVNEIDGKFRKDLYQGIRIGSDIYVEKGRYKNALRNPDNPNDVKLNFNGVLYDEYQSKSRSMFLDTEDIQNQYDIYTFYMENAVALSGNKVQTVILENIPNEFGTDMTERLIKHQEYIKSGFNYVSLGQDSSKEFNNYGNAIDMTLSTGIEVILKIINSIEIRASLITGVSPAQMGEMSPYDSASKTKLVVNRSSLVVRKLFSTHFKFSQMCLNSIINNCRQLYKKGFKGAYILGDRVIDFTVDENINLSYYGVFVNSETSEWKAVEDYKQMAIQLAGQDKLDIKDSVDIWSSKSMTEIKEKLIVNTEKKKQDKTAQLQQQVEDSSKQIQELSKKLEQVDEHKFQLEQQKLQLDREISIKENDIREQELAETKIKNQNDKEIKLKQLELEELQITFSPASKEVKNIG